MNLRNILLATMLAGVGAFSGMALAQDTGGDSAGTGGTASSGAGAGAGAARAHRLSFLSAEDRQHLMRVRRQAMEGDPALKSEQENLKQEWQKARGSDATPEDKQVLRKDLRAYNEQMDAAMLKIDPTIQPILDQMKAHRQARFQQGAGAAGGGDAGTP
jgi:hypothetical protein